MDWHQNNLKDISSFDLINFRKRNVVRTEAMNNNENKEIERIVALKGKKQKLFKIVKNYIHKIVFFCYQEFFLIKIIYDEKPSVLMDTIKLQKMMIHYLIIMKKK